MTPNVSHRMDWQALIESQPALATITAELRAVADHLEFEAGETLFRLGDRLKGVDSVSGRAFQGAFSMFRALLRIAIVSSALLALGACAQFGGISASAGGSFAGGASQDYDEDFDVVLNRARNPRAIYQGVGD